MNSENESILAQKDPILSEIISKVEKPIILSTGDVFHDLVSCIIEQQIHYRSSKRIFARALERSGIEHLTLKNFHLFEEHGLSQLKISARKYESVLSLIEFWGTNNLDFNKLTDEEVILQLSKIKGVGNWSMNMILLYTLQRPCVFPCDDFHLKQVMTSLYGLNPKVKLKAQMLEMAEKWENQKSLAVLYLLAWKNQKN
jgi:DNA-3-methyladenine glycosylase II